MNIFLYKTGRNLNRCIRACHSFGIDKLYLIDCEHSYLKGNLFSAEVELIDSVFPEINKTLVVEKTGKTQLNKVDWTKIENIIIGGENITIPVKFGEYSARIDTPNSLCLTSEAALNIVLYELMVLRAQKIKKFRVINHSIVASGLPTSKDIIYLHNLHGINSVIDLTKRIRNNISSICLKHEIKYIKIPISEDYPDPVMIQRAVDSFLPGNKTLVCCFRGIHRTGIILNKYANIPVDKKQFRNHSKLFELCQNFSNSASAHTCKPE